MSVSKHLAKHLRDVYFGGNWTTVNLRTALDGVHLDMALARVSSLNTIAALLYHINYYVKAQIRVLEGKDLAASDKFSFDHPEFASAADWQNFVNGCFADAEKLASLVEALQEETLWESFVDGKYGNYYRNIQGMIEHTHYHLGQIVVIKKILLLRDKEEKGEKE